MSYNNKTLKLPTNPEFRKRCTVMMIEDVESGPIVGPIGPRNLMGATLDAIMRF